MNTVCQSNDVILADYNRRDCGPYTADTQLLHGYRMLIEWRIPCGLVAAWMRTAYGWRDVTAWIPYADRMTQYMRITIGANAVRIRKIRVAVCGPHAKSCCRNVMKSAWRLGFGVAAMLHASRMWSSFSMFTGYITHKVFISIWMSSLLSKSALSIVRLLFSIKLHI